MYPHQRASSREERPLSNTKGVLQSPTQASFHQSPRSQHSPLQPTFNGPGIHSPHSPQSTLPPIASTTKTPVSTYYDPVQDTGERSVTHAYQSEVSLSNSISLIVEVPSRTSSFWQTALTISLHQRRGDYNHAEARAPPQGPYDKSYPPHHSPVSSYFPHPHPSPQQPPPQSFTPGRSDTMAHSPISPRPYSHNSFAAPPPHFIPVHDRSLADVSHRRPYTCLSNF